MKYIPLILVTSGLLAADAPKAPVIPLAAESEYYRADGLFARAKAAADAASADLQAAVASLQKACGDKFVPYPNGKHIACVPKPPDPPKK